MKHAIILLLSAVLTGCVATKAVEGTSEGDPSAGELRDRFLARYQQAVQSGDYATFFRTATLAGEREEVEAYIRRAGGEEAYNRSFSDPGQAARLQRLVEVMKRDRPRMLSDSQGRETIAYYAFDPPIKGYNDDLDIHGYCFYLEDRAWKILARSEVQTEQHKALTDLGPAMASTPYPLWQDYLQARRTQDPKTQYLLRYRLVEQGNYVAFLRAILHSEDRESLEREIAEIGEQEANTRCADNEKIKPLMQLARTVRDTPPQFYRDAALQEARAYYPFDSKVGDLVGYEFALEGDQWKIKRGSALYSLPRELTPQAAPPAAESKTPEDAETWRPVGTLKGHDWAVTSLAVTPDGQTLVSASLDNTIKLWDLETGTLVKTLWTSDGDITSIAVTPDGRTLVYGGDGLGIVDFNTGERIAPLKDLTDDICTVALTHEGHRLFSGDMEGRIDVWDLDRGTRLASMTGHSDRVNAIAITPDDSTLISGSHDRTLKIWDLQTCRLKKTLTGHQAGVLSIAISPDGKRAASGSWDRTLRWWDLETGDCIASVAVGNDVAGLCFSPNGEILGSITREGTVSIWKVQTRALLKSSKAHEDGLSIAVSPDDRYLLSGGNTNDKTIRIWDLR